LVNNDSGYQVKQIFNNKNIARYSRYQFKRINKTGTKKNNTVRSLSNMLRIICFSILVFIVPAYLSAQTTIWLEDFNDLADGTQEDLGPTAWTIDTTACNFGPIGSFEVSSSAFQGIDTQGEGRWYSEVIDITGYIDVKITVDLFMYALFAGDDDYVRAYYSLNGGPGTLLTNGDQIGNFGSATAFVGKINGSTIQIIVKLTNDFLIIPRFQRFDNIKVFTGPDERFAIQDGDWDDPDTWSYFSGGPTCNCIPDVFSEVHINEVDSGYVVDITSDSRAKELFLYSGGTLQWTSDNDELEIYSDGVIYIQSGATLTENSSSEARIEFAVDNSDYILDNEGILIIDDIVLQNREGQVTFNGSADITITDQLELFDAKVSLLNNSTGTLIVQDDLLFNGDSAELINNGVIQITDDLRSNFFDDGNRITNSSSGTITIGDDVNAFWNGLVIDNYGIIDQNGEFTNIEAGEVQLYNRAGATWNYGGGTGDDDDIELYCNFNANVFEYDNGGDQQVHTPMDGYWHLVVSNSGNKATLGDLDINGNLTISGVSILDVDANGNDINLAGNWSNAGTFDEGSQRVEFDGSTAQTLSNASGETYFKLILNNSGPGITLNDGNITVADTLTMNQGNLFTNAFKATIGTGTVNVGGLTYTSGIVVGKLERWISSPGTGVLFPIGIVSSYRPGTVTFNTLNSGSMEGEFIPMDPGSDGLPLSESGITIQKQFTDGYWNFIAANSLSTSDFDIELIAQDFTSYTIKPNTRVIKRTDSGDWELDGVHFDAVDTAVYRDGMNGGISVSGTQFGLGIGCLPTSVSSVIQDVSCFGGSDAEIDITITGGTSPFIYLWSTANGSGLVATSEDQTGLTVGTYDLTITDDNGCTTLESFVVSQPAAPLSGTITAQTNVACFGESTGNVTIAGSGGTAPYEYSLDGGSYQSSGTFSDLSAGDYTITVQDANLCIFDVPVTITEPAAALDGSIQSQVNVLCFGDATGSVTVAGSDGTAPYQYSLDGGPYQASGLFTGLLAVDYIVTVRDANLCTFDIPVTITEPTAPLDGSIASQIDVACNSDATGSVTVTGTGGTSPYEFSFEGGAYQSSGTFGGLIAGNYTITVRDANLCTEDIPVTISEPLPLTGGITGQTNVDCNGNATGSVSVTGSDGTSPYQYSLDGGSYQSSGTFSGLIANSYTVTIRDANLCTYDVPVTITEPLPLTGSIVSQTDVDCFGDNTGSLTVAGSGGTTPYEYSLDGGVYQSSGTFNGLTANTYTITVRDANLCTYDIPVMITQPATALTGTITTQTDVACYGDATGAVSVTGSGGTSPYEYSLDGGSYQTSGTFSGLDANNYTITIRDANLCTIDVAVTISQPAAPLTGSITTQLNVDCNGNATGNATITGAGGTTPYQYSFDGAPYQTPGTFNGLIAGNYVITIRDANFCTIDVPVTITEPLSLVGSITSQVDPACFGDVTGTVTVSGSDGTSPYEYSLDGGIYQASGTFSGLGASNYTVTIRDANLCTTDVPVSITEPSVLSGNIVSQTEVDCNGSSTGSVTLAGTGGTSPYEYSLDGGTYQPSGSFSGLAANAFTITIRDANLCTYDIQVTITQPDALVGILTEIYNTCFGESSGSFTAAGSGGTSPYEYSLDGGAFQVSGTFTGLVASSYTLTVRDANSCTEDMVVTITQAATAVSGTLLNQVDVTCFGAATGSVTVEGSGGTSPYDYSINGTDFQVSGAFTDLLAGNYNIIIRDANHCTFNIPVTITQPVSSISGSVDSLTDIVCFGDATGEIIVTGSGGTPPYEYSINSGSYQANGTFSALTAALYTITIRDANLCTVDLLAAVSGPDQIAINPVITNASCEGIEDGSIILNASGGVPPYDFLWSNMEVTEDISELATGFYTIQITDANGCIFEQQLEVTLSGVECLLIPNAFIPNGDGMNDTWRIRDIEAYPNATIHIYSRWGQLVFSAEKGYSDPWDGTYKGKELPMDSYFYVIDLKNGSEVITGQVTIIR